MKIIAINGSPRPKGNTSIVLEAMQEELVKEGIEMEVLQIGGKLIHGCIACGACARKGNNRCETFTDDEVNAISEQMRAADGFILAAPTYFGGIPGTMKSFLDRLFYSSNASKPFRNKVATAMAVVRRAGGVEVFNQLSHYLTMAEVATPPGQYWGVAFGREKGEVLQDAEGMQTARRKANAMAWLLKTIAAGKAVPPPRVEPLQRTNFVKG